MRGEDKVGTGGGGQVGTEIHPNRFYITVQQVDVPCRSTRRELL